MMHSYYYKFLLVVKHMKPNIKFILCGDFKQLAPVNDVYEFGNYENSPALFELSDGHRLTLNKCRRSDDEFFINFVKVI